MTRDIRNHEVALRFQKAGDPCTKRWTLDGDTLLQHSVRWVSDAAQCEQNQNRHSDLRKNLI